MFDVDFFMNTKSMKDDILQGAYPPERVADVAQAFDRWRSTAPTVFNIETTNHCNMRCVMCPRTDLMTRKLEVMDQGMFREIVSQIDPFPREKIETFNAFVKSNYNLDPDTRHEDAFFFYVVATHLLLHGYGEPLLDPLIVSRVQACSDRDIPTYFSCVPSNIKMDQIQALMDAGLGVIKFSLDAMTNEAQMTLRGKRCEFDNAYDKIIEVVTLKEQIHNPIQIVIQKIEFTTDEDPARSRARFQDMWRDQPVFAYSKSQDNRWLYEEDADIENQSHHEKQYCEFPFTSMTVMADGSVVPCTQDYDTELALGNVKEASLSEIWNGDAYTRFRHAHIHGTFDSGCKCTERCDQHLLCDKFSSLAHA